LERAIVRRNIIHSRIHFCFLSFLLLSFLLFLCSFFLSVLFLFLFLSFFFLLSFVFGAAGFKVIRMDDTPFEAAVRGFVRRVFSQHLMNALEGDVASVAQQTADQQTLLKHMQTFVMQFYSSRPGLPPPIDVLTANLMRLVRGSASKRTALRAPSSRWSARRRRWSC
jgi:hypothetical protein